MSRLFWKIFFLIWVAQVIGTMSVMMALRLEKTARSDGGTAAISRPTLPAADADVLQRAQLQAAPEQGAVPNGQPQSRRRHWSLLPLEPFVAHLIASLIVSVFLAHYLLQPIRSLRSAFQAAATGNLRMNIGEAGGKRRDELADLLLEFDCMAGQLRMLMDSRQRLFHDVSHEMRSPLARMQAAIGLARQQPENAGYLLIRLESEISRMDRLIGELLALSRLEVQEPGTMDEDIWICDILAAIVEDAQFEARSRGSTVSLSDEFETVVKGNAGLLHRAIENVVRNAVKHAGDGSRIEVEAEAVPEKRQLRIRVSDNGHGVPEAELDVIFRPFFRGSRAEGKVEGHGLGLALAKRAAEAHGGTISAFNLAAGGLCVEMLLPLK